MAEACAVEKAVSVLLIEDNDDHAYLMQLELNRLPRAVEITRFNDGPSALCHLAQIVSIGDRPADVILLDLKLPGQNGLHVLESIKSDVRIRQIPVIVVTTSEVDADRDEALRCGACAYLIKPVDAETLGEWIDAPLCT